MYVYVDMFIYSRYGMNKLYDLSCMSTQNAKLNYSWNSFEDMFTYYLQTDGVFPNENLSMEQNIEQLKINSFISNVRQALL